MKLNKVKTISNEIKQKRRKKLKTKTNKIKQNRIR